MKNIRWYTFVSFLLISASAFFYILHYRIFGDLRHIVLYFIGDIGFVFVQVLLMVLLIDRLLSRREKRSMLDKLNVIMGAFYTDIGTRLLAYLSDCDPDLEKIRKELVVTGEWTPREFLRVKARLKSYKWDIDLNKVDLQKLHNFIEGKRERVLRMLENPNLVEHESFTELLWAVSHLAEELVGREDLKSLPATDTDHLVIDMTRAYGALVRGWMEYMEHLKDNYPYMFSFAMRTNPFDQDASVVFK